jgi:hypothetical protein
MEPPQYNEVLLGLQKREYLAKTETSFSKKFLQEIYCRYDNRMIMLRKIRQLQGGNRMPIIKKIARGDCLGCDRENFCYFGVAFKNASPL